MQDASDAFEAAAATHRTWMPVRVRTDWGNDGYNGDHTIDDLSPQVSAEWAVDHTLDDGYPNTVSFISGTSVPEVNTELSGRAVGGVPKTATAYWSPLRADSPVYGYDRDVAPLTLDMGLVTADGPEYARVFTGQMLDTPVRGGRAALHGSSATRIALMRPVQPPAVDSIAYGPPRPSWPVSWCLYACGLYAGAAPRGDGATIAYYPMHGGLRRFHDGGIANGNIVVGLPDGWYSITVDSDANTTLGVDVDWVAGPYVGAPHAFLTAELSHRMYTTLIPFGSFDVGGADALSQAGAAARLEAWVRGDAADVNNAPGGSGSVSRLFGMQLTAVATNHPYAQLGVNTARKVYVTVYDGTNTRTLTSTGTLPTDGAFYFVGAAYDAATDRLWVNLDGTVESSSPGTISQAGLPAADTWYTTDGSPFLLTYLPCSDITLSTGPQANVDNYPLWRNDASFAPTARVGLSANELSAGVAEPAPREAWQIIAEYAQSELAAVRCDELDVFEYLPLGWWVRDEQQVVQDEISTQRNAGPFDVDYDPSKIRTSVKVTFKERSLPNSTVALGTWRRVLELPGTGSGTDDLRIPPGGSERRFDFPAPVVYLYTGDVLLDNATEAAIDATLPSAAYLTLNSQPDGAGTQFTTGVSVSFMEWDPGGVTMYFVNSHGSALYLANNVNVSPLCLIGIPLTETSTYVQVGDTGGTRGERLLEVDAPAAQTSINARRLAQNLLSNLRLPMATIGGEQSGITVTADPRRQPGDLVTIEDAETGVSGSLWRLQSVRHRGRGASYTQEVVARQVYPICIVGEGIIGQSLVGPNDR